MSERRISKRVVKFLVTALTNERIRRLEGEIKDLGDHKERKKKYRLEDVGGSVVLMLTARDGTYVPGAGGHGCSPWSARRG